jgi:hypothetical protein
MDSQTLLKIVEKIPKLQHLALSWNRKLVDEISVEISDKLCVDLKKITAWGCLGLSDFEVSR